MFRRVRAARLLWKQKSQIQITFSATTALRTTFRVPGDAQPGQTINVVLEATDDGKPHLTRHQRVIVTVQ